MIGTVDKSRCSFWHKNHDLDITKLSHVHPRIKCKRCEKMWEHDGREIKPYGYDSWKDWKTKMLAEHRTPAQLPPFGFTQYVLDSKQHASILAEYVIWYRQADKETAKAIHEAARKDPAGFVKQVFG